MTWCLRYIFKHIFLKKEEIGVIVILLGMLIHGVFAETALWTFTEPEVMIFWLLAGAIGFFIKEKDKIEEC